MSFIVQSYPEKVILSGNPAEITITATTLAALFRRIHVRVLDMADTIIGEDSVPVINGQTVTFDVAEYLKSDLRKNFVLSDFFNPGIENANLTTQAKFEIFETYDNDGDEHDLVTSSNYVVINGGLSRALLQYYGFNSYTFLSKFITEEKRFLTWQPVTTLQRTQIHLLYFLNTTYPNLKSVIKLYFDDETTETITSDALVASQYTVYALNASFFAYDFSSYEVDRTVVKYDIYALGDNGVTYEQITETKTYEINTAYYHHARQFIFRNSLGCYDCVLLNGISEVENKFNRDSGTADDGTNRVFFSNFDSEKSTNSGWLNGRYGNPQKAQDYFTEILLTSEAYEAYKNHVVEIVPTSDSLRVYRDKQYLYSFDFQYKTAYNEEYYSEFLETPFLGIPGAKFRTQDEDYDQITDTFEITVVRTDTFELIEGIGQLVFKIYADTVVTIIRSVDLDVSESELIELPLFAYSNISRIEWSGLDSGYVLFAQFIESNAILIQSDFSFELYDEALIIESIDSYDGTAEIEISGNKIVCVTPGTLYNLVITVDGTERRFPLSEGGLFTVHCVKTAIYALISDFTATTQNTLHENLANGNTLVEDNYSDAHGYVPFAEAKSPIYAT